jgi:hypothetical protein
MRNFNLLGYLAFALGIGIMYFNTNIGNAINPQQKNFAFLFLLIGVAVSTFGISLIYIQKKQRNKKEPFLE